MKTRYLALSLLCVLVVACNNQAQPIDDLPEALFSIAELDAAVSLEATEEILSPLVTELSQGLLADEAQTTSLQNQAVLRGATGLVYYIKHNPSSRLAWQLWQHDQGSNIATLIFADNRPKESVAGSSDGQSIIFSMRDQAASGDYDIYLLRIGQAPARLTNNTTEESDVSMSADGQMVAWQGVSRGLQAVFFRDLAWTSAKVLRSNTASYLQPTLSANGLYISFVSRVNSNYSILLYGMGNNTLNSVYRSELRLEHPSSNNAGSLVAWLEHTVTIHSIKLKNLITNVISTELRSAANIWHPHMKSDGAWLTYGLLYQNAVNVFTRNIASNATARLTSNASPVGNYAMYWQLEPQLTLKDAVHKVLPELREFQLVKIDDQDLIGKLVEMALAAEKDPAPFIDNPMVLELPILSSKGELKSFSFRLYPHNLRTQGGLPILAFDPKTERGEQLEFLSGPSLTFAGFPQVEAEMFLKILDGLKGSEYSESKYQPSTLSILDRSEFEASYFGLHTEGGHSVLQGLRSILRPAFSDRDIEVLIAREGTNYLVYNQEFYNLDMQHVDESEKGEGQGQIVVAPVSHDHNTHDHSTHDASHLDMSLRPQSHWLEDGWKTLHVIPVADDTIYNPDTGTWLYSDWVSKMEAMGNKMNAYYMLTNIGADIPSNMSDLSSNNNRFIFRTRIPEMRVLTPYGKDLMEEYEGSGFTSHCGGDGSYRDAIRKLSNSSKRYDNEYWLWSNRRSTGDGGCSYTQVIGLSPRGTSDCDYIDNRNYTNCGAVGYINLSGDRTQDWISATGMHETGHALNGRHDDDAYGDTGQSWSSHRCTFLGIWQIGPSGPSLMSYTSGTETFCFARSDSDGSPKKNVTLIAEFLHTVLTP